MYMFVLFVFLNCMCLYCLYQYVSVCMYRIGIYRYIQIHTIHMIHAYAFGGVYMHTICTVHMCMYLTSIYKQYIHALFDTYRYAHAGSLMASDISSPVRPRPCCHCCAQRQRDHLHTHAEGESSRPDRTFIRPRGASAGPPLLFRQPPAVLSCFAPHTHITRRSRPQFVCSPR